MKEKNMKIEINTEEIIEELDIRKLIEEKMLSYPAFGEIVDDVLDSEQTRCIMTKKVHDAIKEYMSTEKFKENVIDKFDQYLENSEMQDILDDDRILDMIKEFLKNRLMKSC